MIFFVCVCAGFFGRKMCRALYCDAGFGKVVEGWFASTNFSQKSKFGFCTYDTVAFNCSYVRKLLINCPNESNNMNIKRVRPKYTMGSLNSRTCSRADFRSRRQMRELTRLHLAMLFLSQMHHKALSFSFTRQDFILARFATIPS